MTLKRFAALTQLRYLSLWLLAAIVDIVIDKPGFAEIQPFQEVGDLRLDKEDVGAGNDPRPQLAAPTNVTVTLEGERNP